MEIKTFATIEDYTLWLGGEPHPSKVLALTHDGYAIFASNNITGEYKTYKLYATD